MKRSHWIASVLTAVVFVFVVGTSLAASGAKVVLMAWSDPSRWQGLVNGFLRDNPDWPNEVEVQVTATSGAPYREKLLAMLAGGAGPDIFLVDPAWLEFHDWIREGAIAEPLTEYMKRDSFSPDSMWPVFGDLGGHNGVLYALPLHITPQTMYYNKTRSNELGLPGAATLYQQGQWTFGRLAEQAKKLTRDTNADGQPDQWGVESGLLSVWLSWPYVWSAGGDYFDAQLTKSLADSTGTKRGLEFLHALTHEHQVTPPAGLPGSVNGFIQGVYAFSQNWGQLPGVFVRGTSGEMSFEWAVVPPPKADPSAQHYTPTSVGLWVMNRDSKVKGAAWEVLKWLGSEKGNLAWLQATYFHGIAHPSVFQSKYFRDLMRQPGWDPKLPDIYYSLYMQHARSTPYFAKVAEWERMANGYLGRVARNELALESALEELARQSDALLASGR